MAMTIATMRRRVIRMGVACMRQRYPLKRNRQRARTFATPRFGVSIRHMTARPHIALPGAGRRVSLVVLVSLVALLLLVPSVVRLAAEWPWFASLGYERVFATRLANRPLLGRGIGLRGFALLYANVRF